MALLQELHRKKSKKKKDLGIKIGTPEAKEREDILYQQEESLRKSKINIKIANLVRELSINEIAAEKEKLK